VRRALAGGAVLGAAAGVLVGLVDAAYVWATASASFDGLGEAGRFVVAVVGTLAGAGVLAGIAQGAVVAAVTEAAHALGERRRDAGVWQARLYIMVAVPPVALACAQIFRGPRARAIAHHDAIAVAIGVAALALLWAGLRLWQALYRVELPCRRAWLLATLAALAGIGLYLVDQRVLVRLYPFFHVGLGVLAFAAAELTVALAHLGLRRRGVGLLRPTAALMIGCAACTAGAASLGLIARTRALRTIVVERTALASPLARAVARHEAARAHAPTTPPAAASLPEGPHLGAVDVFLITVDAMRADRLTARTAPSLTSLASRGVVFDRAYTQVPHTSFSLATLLTGKYVFALSTIGLDAASHQTLPEVMRRERYKTAAFYPPSVFTIDRDRLRAMEDSAYGFEYVKYEFMDAPGRTDQVIHFLESEQPARAFVWVHYLEPHEPYDAHPGPFARAREAVDRYDGEVRFVDDEVARLISYIQKTRPHALIVLAADHGEEFGEHGGRYHGTTLYEEQVRVPLAFVSLDGSALAPHHVAAPVGLVDVAPTILALIGIVPSAKMRGRDLGPWLLPVERMAPAAAHGPVFAEIGQQKMIVDGSHKLICDLSTDACSAFDLPSDPGERKNRIDEPWATELRARLDAWLGGESRFETAGAEGDARVRRLVERARQGDKTVATELAALVDDAGLRLEVAHLLATLPPDPATRAGLAKIPDADPARAWADVALARLGDGAARARLPAHLLRACADGGTGDYCARAALASADVPWLARALGRGDADESLQIELSRALGRSHDARALDPLIIQLANVRTRIETIAALADLDDARALPTLMRWVGAEPYVNARARMVALVAALGRHAPAEPRAALSSLAAEEREAPVMAQLLPALHALGDTNVVDLAHARAHTVAGGELWLVGSGTGVVDVTVGDAAARLAFVDGVGHADIARTGTARLRVLDGDAQPRLAFSRRAP
jgi:arylsulfatase A-like enzyme